MRSEPRSEPRPQFRPSPSASPQPASRPSKEEAVDLNALGASSSPTQNSGRGTANPHASGFLGITPNFKFLFDLWFINQPGVHDLTFQNIHSYMFVELMPDSKLTFQFSLNLAGNANFFELAYMVNPRFQVRGGKLLIPFDDSYPHTLYGGRPNLSAFFMTGQTAFLPDLWAEPGVAARYRLADYSEFRLDGTLYITNGFQSSASDPYPPQAGGIYPDFAGTPAINVTDNNRDKAIGLRAQSVLYRKLGIGASFYTCRYSEQSAPSERLTAYGLDSQLRFSSTGTEFRAAVISMNVNVPGDSFTRGGWYFEASQTLDDKRDWKAIFRTGYRQNDSRVIEVSDQRLVGGLLVYKPGLVQWSFELDRDLNDVPGKVNYSFTALRAAVEL